MAAGKSAARARLAEARPGSRPRFLGILRQTCADAALGQVRETGRFRTASGRASGQCAPPARALAQPTGSKAPRASWPAVHLGRQRRLRTPTDQSAVRCPGAAQCRLRRSRNLQRQTRAAVPIGTSAKALHVVSGPASRPPSHASCPRTRRYVYTSTRSTSTMRFTASPFTTGVRS